MERIEIEFVNKMAEGICFSPLPNDPIRKIVMGPGRSKRIIRQEVQDVAGPSRGSIGGVLHPAVFTWDKHPQTAIWRDVPQYSDFAPFRKIVFEADGRVKLYRRKGFKEPEREFPVVEFLYVMEKTFTHIVYLKERPFDADSKLTLFHGIPARRQVPPDSKFARFRRWLITEEKKMKPGDTRFPSQLEPVFELSSHGEEKLRGGSLQKLEKMIKEAEPQLLADLQSLELMQNAKDVAKAKMAQARQ